MPTDYLIYNLTRFFPKMVESFLIVPHPLIFKTVNFKMGQRKKDMRTWAASEIATAALAASLMAGIGGILNAASLSAFVRNADVSAMGPNFLGDSKFE